MPEVYQLDLDDDLLSHLAIPESVQALRAEKVGINLIEDDFVVTVFKYVFGHLHEHGHPPTPTVIAEEFELELNDPLTAINDLIERLRERWAVNNARSVMEGLKDVYLADPAGVPHYMVSKGRELLEVTSSRGDSIGTGEWDRAMTLYDERVLRGPGPSLGFKDIDDHHYGQEGVTTLLASPKTYKSWLGVKAALTNIEAGRNVWLFPLELPAPDTNIRLLCMAADVPEWKYRRGQLSKFDRTALKEASDLLAGLGTYQMVAPPPGHRQIDEMFTRAGDAGADLVIFDQLQYIETNSGKQLGACKTEEYWPVLDRMRHLSADIPIMLIHQFNREVQYAEKMPDMQKAKASSSVEEVSSLILGAWANKDMRKSGLIELGTLASRHYDLQSWEIEIDLTRRCNFELLGIAEHDE